MTEVLSADVQRALQQAVVDVNDAAQASKKKHKKKRPREPDSEAQPEDDQVKAKKKKKTRTSEHEDAPQPSEHEATAAAPTLDATVEKKSKKKKRDKGKEPARGEPAVNPEAPIQPPPQAGQAADDDLAAASADFLSAVVAAASATSHFQEPVPPGYPPQPMPPYPPYPEHLVQYPPPPPDYPFPHPQHPHPPPPFGPPGMYPDLHGILPDLNLASSEELLRTLQDMDITKLATVLKTLGEAGVPTPSNPPLNIPPSFVPPPAPPGPPPVNQVSAKSVAILGRHPKQAKASGTSTRALPPPAHVPAPRPPEEDNPDHAHMLASVWMNASKLAEMVRTHGLVYKKGKFSAIEDAQLRAAIENFRVNKGMDESDITALIFSKDRGRGDAFWQEITSALHLRPITAVYHHVRRLWHPLRGQGKWVPAEDENLREAVAQLGQQWEKISERVGRTASDCRDRWRNHLEGQNIRRSGHWTKEEEEELTRIVSEVTILQGKDIDNDIFWGAVSQRMGGRRGRQQCRIKWTDSLATQIKNEGAKPRWSQLDAYILVHKIDSLKVNDDSEIDWKKLPDEHWNIWSAHTLQRRWLTMKRSVKGYEEMSHAELMDILRTKKAQTPPPQTASRVRTQKQPRSAETIVDSDPEDEDSPTPEPAS